MFLVSLSRVGSMSHILSDGNGEAVLSFRGARDDSSAFTQSSETEKRRGVRVSFQTIVFLSVLTKTKHRLAC